MTKHPWRHHKWTLKADFDHGQNPAQHDGFLSALLTYIN